MKRFGWLILVSLIVYFLFLIRQDIIDNLNLKRDRQNLSKSLASEKASAAYLNKRLAGLKDDDTIEEIARTKLGLIKKGETAYKVIR